jgi:type II secretory pathway pseudopilin PulG
MKKKKHPLTLLEIMIVIFLITLITGVVGYNMRGSVEKGKQFKSKQAAAMLADQLELYMAERGVTPEQAIASKEEAIAEMGLVKDPTQILHDGWGEPFQVSYEENQFRITSSHYHS